MLKQLLNRLLSHHACAHEPILSHMHPLSPVFDAKKAPPCCKDAR